VNHWLLENEPLFRLGVFGALLVTMMVWELGRPMLPLREGRGLRWLANFSLVVLGTLAVRLVAPIGAVAAAQHAAQEEIGLIPMLDLPAGGQIVAAMIALDFVIYVQHWVFHRVPVLWRLHRVHHADRDYDVSTALRFHPVEILISLAIKLGAVYALGAPPIAVLLFEVILNGAAMFNHGNVTLGRPLDGLVRLLIVTPDMHRVHHSVRRDETNSNYGFNLPWWDRIFGTYKAVSQDGPKDLTIGLPEYQASPTRLWRLLTLPFRNDAA
jgi:sterol desaturase/sphingolipid hydroxylase (fatty acid hydroxylase superfamily)